MSSVVHVKVVSPGIAEGEHAFPINNPETTRILGSVRAQLEHKLGVRLSLKLFYSGRQLTEEDTASAVTAGGGKVIGVASVLNPELPGEAEEESSEGYEVHYTGTELLSCVVRDGNLMLDVLSDLAQRDPFFLSKLAVDREAARVQLFDTLRDEEFRLTVRGETAACDPVLAVRMHPCGEFGPEVDRRNVTFLRELLRKEGVDPLPSLEHVLELYLFNDRDIARTLDVAGRTA